MADTCANTVPQILKPDCLSWFARDLTHVEDKIREIERGLQGVRLVAEEKRQIGEKTLRLIRTLLAEAEEVRKEVKEDDEINEEVCSQSDAIRTLS